MTRISEQLAKELGYTPDKNKLTWSRNKDGLHFLHQFSSLDYLDAEIKRLGWKWSRDTLGTFYVFKAKNKYDEIELGDGKSIASALLAALNSRKGK